MIFELCNNKYVNEQEIISGGPFVIYRYCRDVKGKWPEIEHILALDSWYGFYYAKTVLQQRFQPDIEDLYIRNGLNYCFYYVSSLVRYGNV